MQPRMSRENIAAFVMYATLYPLCLAQRGPTGNNNPMIMFYR